MKGTPKLGCDKQVGPLDLARCKRFLDTFSYLIFISVDIRTVNMTVANIDGVRDSLLHLTSGRLPRPLDLGQRGFSPVSSRSLQTQPKRGYPGSSIQLKGNRFGHVWKIV